MKIDIRSIAGLCAALALSTAAYAQETLQAAEGAQTAAVTAPADASALTEAAAPAEATAPVPSDSTSSLTGVPPAGKGLIVFFRPSRMMGAAITFTARESETEIGRLSNGRYFAIAADPGSHEFDIRGGETVRVEVEQGETHYLQLNIAMGMMSGRGVLAPSDKATFEERPLRQYAASAD